MAAWKYFLRFGDRRYFGESKYRPSEGWIDVAGFLQWRPDGAQGGSSRSGGSANVKRTGSLEVDCVTDKATVLLLHSFIGGELRVGNAVMEFRSGKLWIRYTMIDIVLENVMTQGQKISLTLECPEPTVRSNVTAATRR